MKITFPELSLVLLIAPAGAGKSTFARKHFQPTEVISSDFCRGLVSDDENNQNATRDAFDVLHYITAKRLKRRRLTVVDATNVKRKARKPLLNLARKYRFFTVAIAFNLPEEICYQRDANRPNRNVGFEIIHRHSESLRHSLPLLPDEFQYIYILSSVEAVDAATIERQPFPPNYHRDRLDTICIIDRRRKTLTQNQLLEK